MEPKSDRDQFYCDACDNGEIERVGPLGAGSWCCPRCLSVIYGVDRPPAEIAHLLDVLAAQCAGHLPWPEEATAHLLDNVAILSGASRCVRLEVVHFRGGTSSAGLVKIACRNLDTKVAVIGKLERKVPPPFLA